MHQKQPPAKIAFSKSFPANESVDAQQLSKNNDIVGSNVFFMWFHQVLSTRSLRTGKNQIAIGIDIPKEIPLTQAIGAWIIGISVPKQLFVAIFFV